MIDYKYPEEKIIVLHYANILNNANAKAIIDSGYVNSSAQATTLKNFYWSMVDQAVKDHGKGIAIMETEGHEHWLEYIFHTFNGYLVSNGYEMNGMRSNKCVGCDTRTPT